MSHYLFLLLFVLVVSKLVYSFRNIHHKHLHHYHNIQYSTSIHDLENSINLVQNDGPVLSLTLPKRNVRVHIVGCIHGSPTSSSYVKNVIETVNPSSIVLELCDKRYKSLLEDKILIENNEEANHEKEITSIGSVGLLVYCLSILTYAQRPLKIIPGAEFLTAMREAESRNIPIELGDEAVENIIASLKGIGNIKLFLQKPSTILTTIKSMAFSITGNYRYISSNNFMANASWLNILPAFFRETNLVRDTFILMSPSFIPLALVSTIANYVMDNYQSFPFNNFPTDTFDSSAIDHLSQLGDIITNIFTLYWGLVVTNIFRYVIVDRDQIIASKISKICTKLSEEKKNNNNEVTDVVCVLGMLHSNGVIRYLLDEELNE